MNRAILVALYATSLMVEAFVLPGRSAVTRNFDAKKKPNSFNMFDPAMVMENPVVSSVFQESSNNLLLAFSDQGSNLAGTFFQASLLPYLVFLYFLSFRGNQVPALGNFGFQFLLLFVLSTIPSGIISKSVYGFSLADTDYLHGGAELLLTVTNILIVLGFKEAMTMRQTSPIDKPRNIALAIAVGFAALCAIGPALLPGHAPFLFGLGNFPFEQVAQFPWATHAEPVNALSIPTWAIHFSSVYEFLFAMALIWQFAATTGNERWKGLTWGMLPLHASGICACTYHFFYNAPSLQFLVTTQAGLTLLGNITLMLAAFRIAQSNGWTPQELIPTPNKSTSPQGLVADGLALKPLVLKEGKVESNTDLAINLAVLTLVTSYVVKYGELGLDLPFEANPLAALAIILAIPGVTTYYYYTKSKNEGQWNPLENLPKFSWPGQNKDGPSLSMADVKKYGVAGTVAYVLTELAFWLVAFPVAAVALYKSTGHWPDVVNDTNDRAAVLAFIFAGANIARAFVPIRLGAALALAPWVDSNILSRLKKTEDDDDPAFVTNGKEIEVQPPPTPQVTSPFSPTPPKVMMPTLFRELVAAVSEVAAPETQIPNKSASPVAESMPPPSPSRTPSPPTPPSPTQTPSSPVNILSSFKFPDWGALPKTPIAIPDALKQVVSQISSMTKQESEAITDVVNDDLEIPDEKQEHIAPKEQQKQSESKSSTPFFLQAED